MSQIGLIVAFVTQRIENQFQCLEHKSKTWWKLQKSLDCTIVDSFVLNFVMISLLFSNQIWRINLQAAKKERNRTSVTFTARNRKTVLKRLGTANHQALRPPKLKEATF